MALKIVRENMGVVFTPRDEEVYKNSSGTLYPRVMELHHAGDLNGLLLGDLRPFHGQRAARRAHYGEQRRRRDVGKVRADRGHAERVRHPFPARDVRASAAVRRPACGTIVFAGNSVPLDFTSTEISFYISRDHGKTWEFRSSVAKGGRPSSRISMRSAPCGSRASISTPTAS